MTGEKYYTPPSYDKNSLTKTVEQLRASNHALSTFSTLCAHDLKEPLRNIANLSSLLKEAPHLEVESQIYLSHITESCRRLRSLIEGMLTLSYFPHPSLKVEEIPLTKLVQEILQDLDLLICSKNITFDVAPLPVVKGYWVLYHQLFHNLISNIIKHAPHESKTYARIDIEEDTQDWIFTLQDSGTGIGDLAAIKKINAYLRSANSLPSCELGLGLYICKTITNKLDGLIQIQPNSTPGTTIICKIPKTFHLSSP